MNSKAFWLCSALAAAVMGCQPDSGPSAAAPSDPYASPEQVPFLSGADGKVLTEVPLDILASVRAQLLAGGHESVVRTLERQYDFSTGMVRDLAAAKAASLYLESHSAKDPMPAGEGLKGPLPEVPKGIAIPAELTRALKETAANRAGGQ